MFWANQDKSQIVELKKKNLFIARFSNTQGFNWSGNNKEGNISLLVKKVNLPSLNVPFERLHGNQFVHYYHVGEINWEPITITFVDTMEHPTDNNVPKWRQMFFDYLNQNLITEDNRTSMLDLATFCESIKLTSYSTFVDYTKRYKNDGTLIDAKTVNFKEVTDFNGKLQKTDDRLDVTDTFIIKRPKITKIDFGSLDYGSDEANEITVTFLPEWCYWDNFEDVLKEAEAAITMTRN